MTATKSYPVFTNIVSPFQSWRQSVCLMINKIIQPKLPHIVTLLFNGKHFAVLEIFLDKLEFFIYDGLDVDGTGMLMWSKHITHVITTVGVMPTCGKGERLNISILRLSDIVTHESSCLSLSSSYWINFWIDVDNGL